MYIIYVQYFISKQAKFNAYDFNLISVQVATKLLFIVSGGVIIDAMANGWHFLPKFKGVNFDASKEAHDPRNSSYHFHDCLPPIPQACYGLSASL